MSPKIVFRCDYCGSHFSPRRADARFCSDNCRKAAQRYRRSVSRSIDQFSVFARQMSARAVILSPDEFYRLEVLRDEITSILKVNRDSRRVTDKVVNRPPKGETLR